MRCPQCQFKNEKGAKFCGNCGAALTPVSPHPAVAKPVSPQVQVYCSRCGAPNEAESIFCESCGSRLTPQANHRPHPSSKEYAVATKTSAAWWLMPIFLMWLGGVVAWLVVRETDRAKARHMLWLGIAMTLFWPIFWGLLGTCLGPTL